jgi:hypothetical protein
MRNEHFYFVRSVGPMLQCGIGRRTRDQLAIDPFLRLE